MMNARCSLFADHLLLVMFYLMTDATSKRDHVLAFFSKVLVTLNAATTGMANVDHDLS
jgi:hypothetical protein